MIYTICFILLGASMMKVKRIRLNPVQKNMHKFNVSKTFKDKKNDYQRKEKYPGKCRDYFINYVNFY